MPIGLPVQVEYNTLKIVLSADFCILLCHLIVSVHKLALLCMVNHKYVLNFCDFCLAIKGFCGLFLTFQTLQLNFLCLIISWLDISVRE